MLTAKENVKRTVRFEHPDRVVTSLPECNDFFWIGMNPGPDGRPSAKKLSTDEWGCVWENIGICNLGEVKEYPLKDWSDFDKLKIPDVNDPARWTEAVGRSKDPEAREKFVMAFGISLYERVHFLRGLENTWEDIYLEPENLKKLIGILVDMNKKAIAHFAKLGADGYMFCDDWGLQDKLMISPEKWREFWKPAYTEVYKAAHEAGLLTFLHSCGYIVEILDDLIDAGLDVIQMEQQQNMGLDLLHKRFSGRITFWCPVDIQNMMCKGTPDQIKAYARELFAKLSTPAGGFIGEFYGDPRGAGHKPEAIAAQKEAFLSLKY